MGPFVIVTPWRRNATARSMLGDIRQSRGARGLLAALASFVLLFQMLVPAGFMPVRTAHGVMVTLCTGQGAMNVMVDRDSVPVKKHQPGNDGGPMQQHCPFAGAGQPVAPALPAVDIALPAWLGASGPIAFALKTGFIARLAAPPPPSSGPPATA